MQYCIFCKVVRKEAPSLSIYEDEKTLAFMELFPSAPGHLMVMPKRHGLSILDYERKELGDLLETVKKVSDRLKKVMECDALTIGINHLEKKGVPHLHIHIIPRWENDNGGIIQSIVQKKSNETREKIAEKLRKD